MDDQNTNTGMNTNPENTGSGGTKPRRPRAKAIGFIIILLIILGAGYYFVVQTSNSEGENNVEQETTDITEGEQAAQQATDEEEILDVVSQAEEHILLPEGETPVMATVANAEALRAEQPFYENVVNGDHVLVYQQAQRAFIYSPSRDVIVNVGPIVINEPEGETATQ